MTYILIIALCLVTSAGYADGPSSIPGDQCDTPFIDFADYAAQFPGAPLEILQGWYDTGVQERLSDCSNPWAPPIGTYDDDTLLGYVFSGDHSPHDTGGVSGGGEPPLAPIPLPPTILLLAAALLTLKRKKP
jgi:hypothetical protein